MFDRILHQASRYLRRNPRKASQLAHRAAQFADKRTHGRYSSQINSAVRKVDSFAKRGGGRGHTWGR